MKLSIIISVLNSHEIVRRQTLYFEKMGLPDDVEVLFIDDGSNPPLQSPYIAYRTNDKRPWTVELARNRGAKIARGEYLLMTDIDYIIPLNAIEAARKLKEDKMGLKRQFGVLTEQGEFTQDHDVLRQYGLLEQRITDKKLRMPPHPNNFVMKKETFWMLGGYREDLVGNPYPNGGDRKFKRVWAKAYAEGKVTIQHPSLRPIIYMFPNGQFCGDVDYNPFNLFHDLSRKTESNYWYKKNAGMSR